MAKNNNYIIFVFLIILVIFGIYSSINDDEPPSDKSNKKEKVDILPPPINKELMVKKIDTKKESSINKLPDIEFIKVSNRNPELVEDSFELVEGDPSTNSEIERVEYYSHRIDDSMELI
jgi:hypothetical protein